MVVRPARLIPYLHYPVVMTTTFALFAILRNQGASLVTSTYVPVLYAAGMVTMLELKFPHRSEWRPPVSEIKTDLEFMTIVQLVFPPLVGFVFTYALIAPARALQLPISALWPHGLPIWVQTLLMILVVDLLRYWLQRAAHQNDTLWRLHSVHHSVEQMYWLNTARFHLRSLQVIEAARALRVGVIVGAQVGETSLLTRAALTVAHAAGETLVAQEGAFGTFLLERDVCDPPLMFGSGGVLDVAAHPMLTRPGWGL